MGPLLMLEFLGIPKRQRVRLVLWFMSYYLSRGLLLIWAILVILEESHMYVWSFGSRLLI